MRRFPVLTALFLLPLALGWAQPRPLWLDDLPIGAFTEGIRPVQQKVNYAKAKIQIAGTTYDRGLGAQSVCVLSFILDRHARRFTALVGADDAGNADLPITFTVVADRKVLFDSGEMHVGDPAKAIDVDLTGVQHLGLLITDKVGGIRNKRTYGNWANAQFLMDGDARPAVQPNSGERLILTPPTTRAPRINSPKVFGATPGNPFLTTIAAAGERPMTFAAEDLPPGLSLDATTGIITGKVTERGTYRAKLSATNAAGTATQLLTIKIGDTIALTPPMGWNGWNAWADSLDGAKVIASAEAMVATGLINHGWSYVNIDDTWQGVRGGPLDALQPNGKFPEFAAMVRRIHALGLKAGLYSTPYIQSYGGYPGVSSNRPHGGETFASMQRRAEFRGIGAYKFEPNDARQMAEWGIDFLKYDWRIDLASAERMSAALRQSGRDVVFSLSNNAPIEKAADWARVANMYRSGPDIRDSWTSLYLVTFLLDPWAATTGPGHWADPDMMILGNVSTGAGLHPTRLTPDEQYSHMSLFCLLSAPLLIGCPIEQLDPFTLGLLTNDEVIAIDQDPLGKPARFIADTHGVQLWLKPLEDGAYAVGLFNTDDFGKTPQSYFRWDDEVPKDFELRLADLGLTGKWLARDLWRQKDLGEFSGSITTSIRHHGVVLLRLTKK
jgi:alpha-galactosidase